MIFLSFTCINPGKECNPKPSVITHNCNSSTREAEAGGASKVGDQPGLSTDCLKKKKKFRLKPGSGSVVCASSPI